MTDDSNLLEAAWQARELAQTYGPTKVGAAALDASGQVHVGCNIEHRYRSHDIHAEVCALSRLISSGGGRAVTVAIVAEREQFTPCGACMDWIVEIGGLECRVLVQSSPSGPTKDYKANDLMPHYPV